MEDRVILTGGYDNKNTVSVYSTSGWMEDLPDLLQGRYGHSCGHYVNDDNNMVMFHTIRKYSCLNPLPGIFGNRGLWL